MAWTGLRQPVSQRRRVGRIRPPSGERKRGPPSGRRPAPVDSHPAGRASTSPVRARGHAVARRVDTHVVGLELEVRGQIPVRAEGPVVLAAAVHRAVVEIQRAVARRQLHRAPGVGRLGVGDVAGRVRTALAGQQPARGEIAAVGAVVGPAAVARDVRAQPLGLQRHRAVDPDAFQARALDVVHRRQAARIDQAHIGQTGPRPRAQARGRIELHAAAVGPALWIFAGSGDAEVQHVAGGLARCPHRTRGPGLAGVVALQVLAAVAAELVQGAVPLERPLHTGAPALVDRLDRRRQLHERARARTGHALQAHRHLGVAQAQLAEVAVEKVPAVEADEHIQPAAGLEVEIHHRIPHAGLLDRRAELAATHAVAVGQARIAAEIHRIPGEVAGQREFGATGQRGPGGPVFDVVGERRRGRGEEGGTAGDQAHRNGILETWEQHGAPHAPARTGLRPASARRNVATARVSCWAWWARLPPRRWRIGQRTRRPPDGCACDATRIPARIPRTPPHTPSRTREANVRISCPGMGVRATCRLSGRRSSEAGRVIAHRT